MKILGIIPARGGSKGVPKKNIRKINGLPLIAYTINEALKSKYLTRIIVSTDNDEIKDISLSFGAEVPFIRPAEFSTDIASSASVIKHALEWIENDEGEKYDFIIELMCTNPLKNAFDIDSCIEKLISTGADSVIAVHKIEDHHPIRVKRIVDDFIENFCLPEVVESRRQDLKPEAYVRSGSIYALNRDHFFEYGARYGSKNSRPYILPEERAINIDTENDFLVAEYIINKIK